VTMCLEECVLCVLYFLYILLPELGTSFDHDIMISMSFPVSRVKQTFYTVSVRVFAMRQK